MQSIDFFRLLSAHHNDVTWLFNTKVTTNMVYNTMHCIGINSREQNYI